MNSYGQEQREQESAALVKGIWADSYRYYLKYHGQSMNQEMWQAAAQDFGDIVKKYNGTPACVRVMLAALAQLEEEMR